MIMAGMGNDNKLAGIGADGQYVVMVFVYYRKTKNRHHFSKINASFYICIISDTF